MKRSFGDILKIKAKRMQGRITSGYSEADDTPSVSSGRFIVFGADDGRYRHSSSFSFVSRELVRSIQRRSASI